MLGWILTIGLYLQPPAKNDREDSYYRQYLQSSTKKLEWRGFLTRVNLPLSHKLAF